MKYELRSALQCHRDHPVTFEIPDAKRIKALKVGDFVKLIFIAPGGAFDAERMWVKITALTGRGRARGFTGTLANKPVFIKAAFGDVVSFGPEHIAATEH